MGVDFLKAAMAYNSGKQLTEFMLQDGEARKAYLRYLVKRPRKSDHKALRKEIEHLRDFMCELEKQVKMMTPSEDIKNAEEAGKE